MSLDHYCRETLQLQMLPGDNVNKIITKYKEDKLLHYSGPQPQGRED